LGRKRLVATTRRITRGELNYGILIDVRKVPLVLPLDDSLEQNELFGALRRVHNVFKGSIATSRSQSLGYHIERGQLVRRQVDHDRQYIYHKLLDLLFVFCLNLISELLNESRVQSKGDLRVRCVRHELSSHVLIHLRLSNHAMSDKVY
jgi:hypothetical protein